MALVITVLEDDWVTIGEVRLKARQRRSNAVTLIIEAPKDLKIHRSNYKEKGSEDAAKVVAENLEQKQS
jgi:sRNA-binding carbon storage regulator CsrA